MLLYLATWLALAAHEHTCATGSDSLFSGRLQEGLRRTVEWYLKNGTRGYWDHGDMDLALEAHPTLQLPASGFNGAH